MSEVKRPDESQIPPPIQPQASKAEGVDKTFSYVFDIIHFLSSLPTALVSFVFGVAVSKLINFAINSAKKAKTDPNIPQVESIDSSKKNVRKFFKTYSFGDHVNKLQKQTTKAFESGKADKKNPEISQNYFDARLGLEEKKRVLDDEMNRPRILEEEGISIVSSKHKERGFDEYFYQGSGPDITLHAIFKGPGMAGMERKKMYYEASGFLGFMSQELPEKIANLRLTKDSTDQEITDGLTEVMVEIREEFQTTDAYQNLLIKLQSDEAATIDEDEEDIVKTMIKRESSKLENTVAMCILELGDNIYIANVGNCRAILVDPETGEFKQLTQDVDPSSKRLCAESENISPRPKITKLIKSQFRDNPNEGVIHAKKGDYIVFASHGLWDQAKNSEVGKTILQMHQKKLSSSQMAMEIINSVPFEENNYTVGVIQIGE